jgi:hypothetical protein
MPGIDDEDNRLRFSIELVLDIEDDEVAPGDKEEPKTKE